MNFSSKTFVLFSSVGSKNFSKNVDVNEQFIKRIFTIFYPQTRNFVMWRWKKSDGKCFFLEVFWFHWFVTTVRFDGNLTLSQFTFWTFYKRSSILLTLLINWWKVNRNRVQFSSICERNRCYYPIFSIFSSSWCCFSFVKKLVSVIQPLLIVFLMDFFQPCSSMSIHSALFLSICIVLSPLISSFCHQRVCSSMFLFSFHRRCFSSFIWHNVSPYKCVSFIKD